MNKLSVVVKDSSGALVAHATVTATLSDSAGRTNSVSDQTTDGTILASYVKATTNEQGLAELMLVANTLGIRNTRYLVEIYKKDRQITSSRSIVQMPDTDVFLHEIVEAIPVTPVFETSAAVSAAEAEESANIASSVRDYVEGIVPDIEQWAASAEAQALLSAAARNSSEAERIITEDLRDDVEIMLKAIFASLPVYADTTEGLNNTSDGDLFKVLDETTTLVYKNEQGLAELLVTYEEV